MRRIALALVLAGAIGAAPKPASPLQSFAFMIGSWTCSYNAGKQSASYEATMSWALGGSWIRERDTFTGGGGDEGLFTYDPDKHQWTEFVAAGTTTTLFVGPPLSGAHLAYHSVYPDASMNEKIDQVSPTKYTIHFAQTISGKTTRSFDVCTKH